MASSGAWLNSTPGGAPLSVIQTRHPAPTLSSSIGIVVIQTCHPMMRLDDEVSVDEWPSASVSDGRF